MAKSFKAYESKNAAVPDTSSHFVGDPVALRAASWSFAHPGDDEQHFQSTAQLQMASVLSAKGGRAPPATDQLELRRTSLQLWRSDDGATGPTMYTSTTAPLSAGYVPLPQPKKKYGLNYGDPAQLKPAGAVKGTKDAPEFCLGTTTPEERNELFRSMSSTSYKPTSRADLAVKSLPPQLRISSLQIGDGHSTHFARKETSTHPSQKKKSLTRFPLPEPPQENLVPLTELNFVPEGVSQVKGSICFGVDKLEYTTTMVNDFFLDRDSAGAVVKAETPIPPFVIRYFVLLECFLKMI
jgi:hypothetical protein